MWSLPFLFLCISHSWAVICLLWNSPLFLHQSFFSRHLLLVLGTVYGIAEREGTHPSNIKSARSIKASSLFHVNDWWEKSMMFLYWIFYIEKCISFFSAIWLHKFSSLLVKIDFFVPDTWRLIGFKYSDLHVHLIHDIWWSWPTLWCF